LSEQILVGNQTQYVKALGLTIPQSQQQRAGEGDPVMARCVLITVAAAEPQL
jgi:hypothetical protein